MRSILGILLLFSITQITFGQQEHLSIPKIVLPKQDNEALRNQELSLRSANRSPEFAVSLEYLISPTTHGRWLEKENGQTVWQVQIESSGAYSLNFGFTQFKLPRDAVLLIFPPDKHKIYGPFTAEDNEIHESLWTPIMEGDAFIIEVSLPKTTKRFLELQLQYINHDFLGFSRVLSGDCHIDVLCGSEDGWAQLDAYRDVMQSVGLVSIGGRRLGTGFLVNNGRNDCTPYFITANHCGLDQTDARSMVVYWNYQNSYCRPPNGFQSARPGDGSLETYNTGAFFLASAEKSDFTLFRLDDPVVEAANAYFAGWNLRKEMPQNGVFSIHHPSTDEKRIAISNESPYPGKWNAGNKAFPDGDHLIVPKWTQGSTEEGSSGAPLFNSNKQVIGLLHGGRAECGNDEFDAFGWIRSAWFDGGSPSSRLKDWLDPDAQGLEVCSGRWAAQCEVALVADLLVQNSCLPGSGSFTLTASDAFDQAIKLDLVYQPEDLNVQLNMQVIAPGSSATLTYTPDEQTEPGIYTVVVRGSNARDTVYTDLEIILERSPLPFDLTTPQKNKGEVNGEAVLNWHTSPNTIRYQVTIARDEDFGIIQDQFLQTDTFLIYDNLDFSSTYFWKVLAINNCGVLESTVGEFRTAPDIRLLVLESPEPSCANADLNFKLQLGYGFVGPSQVSARLVPDPGGFNISFGRSSGSVLPGELFELDLLSSNEIPVNTYQLVLEADDGIRIGRTSISFTILGNPTVAKLLEPAENWVSLVADVHFTWTKADSNDQTILEVAQDFNFNKPIFSQAVIGEDAHLELNAGDYFWRIRSENTCGFSFSTPRKLQVYQHDQVQLNGTRIFIEPTPSRGPLTLRFSEVLKNASFQLLNLHGQVLLEEALPVDFIASLDLSNYPNGIYLIRIKAKRSSATKKIILQK